MKFNLAMTDLVSSSPALYFGGPRKGGAKLERAPVRRKPANHESNKNQGAEKPEHFNYITFKNKVRKIALKKRSIKRLWF